MGGNWMANRKKVGTLNKDFEGHKGRPGKVGGSLPRGAVGIRKPQKHKHQWYGESLESRVMVCNECGAVKNKKTGEILSRGEALKRKWAMPPRFSTAKEAEDWANANLGNGKLHVTLCLSAKPLKGYIAHNLGDYIDVRSAQETVDALRELEMDYPEIFNKMKEVCCEIPRSGNWWGTANGGGGGTITLNFLHFKDYDHIKRQLDKSIEYNWHPKGCNTIKSIIDHEFGHLLDYHLSVNYTNFAYAPYALQKIEVTASARYRTLVRLGEVSGLHEQFMSSTSKLPKVSYYAKHNASERFAETFAYLRNRSGGGISSIAGMASRMIGPFVFADKMQHYLDCVLPKISGNKLIQSPAVLEWRKRLSDGGDFYWTWVKAKQEITPAGAISWKVVDISQKEVEELYEQHLKPLAEEFEKFGVSRKATWEWHIDYPKKHPELFTEFGRDYE